MKRVLAVALLVVVVASCSRVQLFYRQLDWMLPMYLENYFGFDVEQQRFVDGEVEVLLQWHCSTQLLEYSRLLREASLDLQRRTMTQERLWQYSDRIETLWTQIVSVVLPPSTELLRSMSDSQVDELKQRFAKDNAEAEKEFKGIPAEDISARQIRDMSERLENWFGPLNPDQQRTLSWWADRFRTMGESGLMMRKKWQQALLQALAQRHSPSFESRVAELFTNPRSLYTDAHRQQLEHNWKTTIEMVYRIGIQADSGQLDRLSRVANAFSDDFEQLACVDSSAARAGN